MIPTGLDIPHHTTAIPACNIYPAMVAGIFMGIAIATTVFVIYLMYRAKQEDTNASTNPGTPPTE